MSTQDISLITDFKSSIVDNNFMGASFNQSTRDMFKLLSSLYEKIISSRDFDSGALPVAGFQVSGPDIQAWITRTTMDGQKVDI